MKIRILMLLMLGMTVVSCEQIEQQSNVSVQQEQVTNKLSEHITKRKSADRGYFDHDWLKTYHTFSFGSYASEDYEDFRDLWVINEDIIKKDSGFGDHEHENMEILVYLISGSLEHTDSLGNKHVMQAGDVHLMSAGTGVTHAERNAYEGDTHFIIVWISPDRNGIEPAYQKWQRPENIADMKKIVLASKTGTKGAMKIQQDASIYKIQLDKGEKVTHQLEKDRGLWLQVIDGSGMMNGVAFEKGDGLHTEAGGEYQFIARDKIEALLIDLM